MTRSDRQGTAGGELPVNVSLIGMPGVGKSTVGVLLAKALSLGFVDTDLVIQARAGERLQVLLDRLGRQAFLELEERTVLELRPGPAVIATGGSVVYGAEAMACLRRLGPVVLLDLPVSQLEHRLANLRVRGVVMEPGRSLDELARERRPLYRRYADVTVDCLGQNQDQIVAEIVEVVGGRTGPVRVLS
jgi:shikimate kinase